MLKLTASHGRKMPVEGQQFASQQYYAAIEVELSDNMSAGEITGRIHETFQLCRKAVEEEFKGKALNENEEPIAKPSGDKKDKKISNAQARFALDLARKAGLSPQDLTGLVRHEFGVDGLYELTGGKGGQASELIELLKTKKAA